MLFKTVELKGGLCTLVLGIILFVLAAVFFIMALFRYLKGGLFESAIFAFAFIFALYAAINVIGGA